MPSSDQPAAGSRSVAEWLWPFLPMAIAAFSLSALICYHLRLETFEVQSALQHLYAELYHAVGLAPAVVFFLLLLTWSSIWFATGRLDRPVSRLARLLAVAVLLGVFLNLGDGSVSPAAHKGALGAWLAQAMFAWFGYLASLVLSGAMTFAALMLATDFLFADSFERLARQAAEPEQGVEPAVTEHLRQLATALPPLPSAAAAAAPQAATTTPAVARDQDAAGVPLAAEPVTLPDPEPAVPAAADAADELGWRRTAFQRRLERDAARAAAVAAASDASTQSEGLAADAEPSVAETPRSVAGAAVEGGQGEAVQAGLDGLASLDGRDGLDGGAAALEPAAEPSDAAAAAPGNTETLADAAPAEVAFDATAAARLDPAEVTAMEEASAMDAVPPWLDQVVGHAAPMPQSPASWSGEALVPEPEVPPAATASDDVDASAAGPTPPLEPPQVDPREPTIAIPRPEAAASSRLPSPPRAAAERAADEVSVRQQNLFGAGLEEDLVQEAIELVLGSRRATASLLQRKLRIDYEMACRLLVELAARGIIALDADAAQGRVIG
jgi:hypothetical protein